MILLWTEEIDLFSSEDGSIPWIHYILVLESASRPKQALRGRHPMLIRSGIIFGQDCEDSSFVIHQGFTSLASFGYPMILFLSNNVLSFGILINGPLELLVPQYIEDGSGYHQKDRKPSQNDKTEHGMENDCAKSSKVQNGKVRSQYLKNRSQTGEEMTNSLQSNLNPLMGVKAQ
ncbi:hypothetical protein Tco_1226012 [Tanacetum coccineum]